MKIAKQKNKANEVFHVETIYEKKNNVLFEYFKIETIYTFIYSISHMMKYCSTLGTHLQFISWNVLSIHLGNTKLIWRVAEELES